MEKRPLAQILITFTLILYFIFGYLPINTFNAKREIFYNVGYGFEKDIPFLSPFILGYLMVYVSILLIYAIIPNWEIFKKMAWGFFFVMTAHYLFFLVFPVKMIWRPEIIDAHNIFERLSQWTFSIDQPVNCFPSLHVAFPTLAAVISWRFIPKWRYYFIAMVLITMISVILIKQHYILDTFAGAAVSILIGVLIPQKPKTS